MPRGYYRLGDVINSKSDDERSILCWEDRLRLLRSIANELSCLHERDSLYGEFDAQDVLINAWDLDFLVSSLRHKDELPSPAKGALAVENQKKRDMFFFGAFMIQVLTYDSQTSLFTSQKERRRSSLFGLRAGTSAPTSEHPHFVEYLQRMRLDDGAHVDPQYEAKVADRIETDVRSLLASQVVPVNASTTDSQEEWQFSTIELCAQCCTGYSENRPAADVVFDWVDSILEDLKVASAKGAGLRWDQQFGSRLKLVQDYTVSQLSIEDQSDLQDGYDSDDSFLPPAATTPIDLEGDVDSQGEDATVTTRDMKRMSINTLGLFLSKMSDEGNQAESMSVAEIREQYRVAAAAKKGNRGRFDKSRKPKRVAQFKRVSRAALGQFTDAFQDYQERFQGAPVLSPEAVASRFDTQLRLTEDEILGLLIKAEFILKSEPNILSLKSPAKIVGDIHGQYFDLRNMFAHAGGAPHEQGKEQYVFLGDYVDRGSFSCEVLLYLLSLKVAYPDQLVLLRGNHECDAVSSYFGFKDECEVKYGKTVFHRCLKCFNAMPIAAVLETSAGRVLCCHGGISPNIQTLLDIEQCDRFQEPGMNGLLCDLLWADPVGESDDLVKGGVKAKYLPNPARGCSFKFSNEALLEFLDRNNLIGIVRGHEVQEAGFQFRFVKPEADAPRESDGSEGGASSKRFVLTVFSAPNYCDRYGNKGAYIVVEDHNRVKRAFKTVQFEHVLHPEPKDFESVHVQRRTAFEETCPYMPTSLGGFVKRSADFGQQFGSAKVRKIFSKFEKFPQFGAAVKGRPSNSKRGTGVGAVSATASPKSTKSDQYQAAAQSDSINEMHPVRVEERIESASKRLETRIAEQPDSFGEGFVHEKSSEPEPDSAQVPRPRSSSHAPLKDKKVLSFFDRIKRLSMRPDHRKDLVIFTPRDSGAEGRPLTIKRKSFLEKEHMSLVTPFAEWLSTISGTTVSNVNFCTDLSDGVALCHLVRLIPDSRLEKFTVPTNGRSLNLFQKRENILEFQQGCRRLGLNSVFGARELEQWKLSSIMPTLIQLARLVQEVQEAAPGAEPVHSPTSLAAREGQQPPPADALAEEGEEAIPPAQSTPKAKAAATPVPVSIVSSFETERPRSKLAKKVKEPGMVRVNTVASQGTAENPHDAFVSFSQKELLTLQLLFVFFDRDDDGFITVDDLVALSQEEGTFLPASIAQNCVEAVDADTDNRIGTQDFLKFAAHLKELREQETLAAE